MFSMDTCTVVKVHDSGLLDLRALTTDKFYERINTIDREVEFGDQMVVISDGNQTYAFGRITPPQIDDNGNTTISDVNNDLTDLSGEKSLVSSDEFGNQSRVVVSRGGGVINDTGEFCLTHHDPGQNSINSYCERVTHISIPRFSEETHDGNLCTSTYKWRTVVDAPSVDRDLLDQPSKILDKGVTVNVSITENEPISANLCKNGVEFVSYSIDSDGNTEYSNTTGDFEISLLAGNIDVETTVGSQRFKAGLSTVEINSNGNVEILTPNGQISVDPLGKVYIGNKQLNLLFILSELLMNQLINAQTVTALGPKPLIPLSVGGVAVQQLINLIRK